MVEKAFPYDIVVCFVINNKFFKLFIIRLRQINFTILVCTKYFFEG